MATNGNGLTAKECIAVVDGSKGFVTVIAKRLGITRSYVYQLQKKFSTFADAIKDEREGNKDFAESKLMEQINDGNVTAIIFYLKTQAKDRGYVERWEQTGKGGGPIDVRFKEAIVELPNEPVED